MIGKTVYIAGPYTPDPETRQVTLLAATRLLNAGHAPFVPHLSHYWDELFPSTYERWMDWCLHWVSKCDWVYRVPGASLGADRETAHAEALGIPVWDGPLDGLIERLGEES